MDGNIWWMKMIEYSFFITSELLAEQQPVGRWAATRAAVGWIKAWTRVAI